MFSSLAVEGSSLTVSFSEMIGFDFDGVVFFEMIFLVTTWIFLAGADFPFEAGTLIEGDLVVGVLTAVLVAGLEVDEEAGLVACLEAGLEAGVVVGLEAGVAGLEAGLEVVLESGVVVLEVVLEAGVVGLEAGLVAGVVVGLEEGGLSSVFASVFCTGFVVSDALVGV